MLNRSLCLMAALAILPLAQACGSDESSEASDPNAVRAGSTVTGQVASCHDGDTCSVKLKGQYRRLTVRLAGIDAPEVSGGSRNGGQPMGKDSRNALNDSVKGRYVTIKTIELDPYGRMVGEIYLGKRSVNMELVEKGLAEAYRWADNRINKKAYRDAERRAKKAQLGIWKLDKYESPGSFRRRTK